MKNIPIIQEIWIIARNGLHIGSSKISIDKKDLGIDGDMFSGFIAAINAFTSEIGLEKCKSGNTTYDIWKAMSSFLIKNGVEKEFFDSGRIGHSFGLDLTELPSKIGRAHV